MATTTVIKLTTDRTSADMTNQLVIASGGVRATFNHVADFLQSVAGGVNTCTMQMAVAEASGVAASGTVTISSGSGTITATINGVAIAVTWTTSDANTGALLSAAINASANALVAGIVTASDNGAGVVTVTAVEKSKLGNGITLAASGTGATASGARLTGGVAISYTPYAQGR